MPDIPEGIKASGIFKSADGKSIEIREVWASNVEEEMEIIQEILEKYPYVAMVSIYTLKFIYNNYISSIYFDNVSKL